MKKKSTVVLCSGMAAAGLLASAVAMAAPQAMSDSKLDKITGKSNAYTFGSTSTTTTTNITETGDNSANIQFGWYQWSDVHTADTSLHKGANDQSGSSSLVQNNITGTVNSLVWGSIGQNTLVNAPTGGGTAVGDIGGGQTNMAYGVFAGGGF